MDFLCLTGSHQLTSETWTIVHVSAPLAEDSVRSSRYFKIFCDAALADYEQTIYVDNSVLLFKDPVHLLEHLAEAPFVLCRHPDRDTVYWEFKAVAAMGLDTPDRLDEQLNAYRNRRPEILEERPSQNTILVRQHTDEVARTMRLWMDHVLRYSRRDQLSLNYVLAETGLPIQHMHVDLRNYEWASWPHTPGCGSGGGISVDPDPPDSVSSPIGAATCVPDEAEAAATAAENRTGVRQQDPSTRRT